MSYQVISRIESVRLATARRSQSCPNEAARSTVSMHGGEAGATQIENHRSLFNEF